MVPPPARLATPGDVTYQNVVNENGIAAITTTETALALIKRLFLLCAVLFRLSHRIARVVSPRSDAMYGACTFRLPGLLPELGEKVTPLTSPDR